MDFAHKRRWQIAEVVFGVPFLVAIALQRTAPLSLRGGFLTPAFIPGGAALIIVGVTLVVLARREFVLHLPALVACHYVPIGPEERYLAARFGEVHRLYAASVHRWLGRARHS